MSQHQLLTFVTTRILKCASFSFKGTEVWQKCPVQLLHSQCCLVLHHFLGKEDTTVLCSLSSSLSEGAKVGLLPNNKKVCAAIHKPVLENIKQQKKKNWTKKLVA